MNAKIRLFITISTVFIGSLLVGCVPLSDSGSAREVTLFVGPELADCIGVAPQKCMQVKEGNAGEWEFFYGQIDGFDYEAGYQYELLVNITKIDNPPADASNLQYELIEVVGKVAVEDDVDSAGLTDELLANATYSGIYTETIQLNDGEYEGKPFVEGGASRPLVTMANYNPIVYGDLNADGLDDAAVLLVENSGGSGIFTYLAAVIDTGSEPANLGTVWIGDRTQIRSVEIADNQIVMEYITQGPDDAFCCPTLMVRHRFALQNGELVEIAREELGTVSLAELEGTTWVLTELDMGTPVEGDAVITLEFADGALSGSSGCNSYSGSVEPSDEELSPQILRLATPLAVTAMACADESVMLLEQEYLTKLGGLTQWSYVVGNLVISYQDGDDYGSLIFEPHGPEMPSSSAAGGLPTLVGNPWSLVQIEMMNDTLMVPAPEASYILNFAPDGTFSGRADCNNINGTYGEEGAQLVVSGIASTRMLCPEGSLFDDFVQGLEAANSYVLEDGHLFVSFGFDSGIMEFAPME